MSLSLLTAYTTPNTHNSKSTNLSDIESRLEQISLNLIQQSLYSPKSKCYLSPASSAMNHAVAKSLLAPTNLISTSPNINIPGNTNKNGKGKKVVRFADMLGLQLVTERIIASSPSMFYYNSSDDDENEDLNNLELLSSIQIGEPSQTNAHSLQYIFHTLNTIGQVYETQSETNESESNAMSVYNRADPDQFIYDNLRFTWQCGFEQPGLAPDFYSQLNEKKVCLESITTDHFILNGFVRVLNLSTFKRVFIRYTLNRWASSLDFDCNCLLNSTQSDQNDRFKFSIILDKNKFFEGIDAYRGNCTDELPSLKLEFAICLEVRQSEDLLLSPSQSYWDNNNGKNYHYNCFFKII